MSQKTNKKNERPLIDVESIKRIQVRPDEILAIELPGTATQDSAKKFNDFLEKRFPELRFFTYIGQLKFKSLQQTKISGSISDKALDNFSDQDRTRSNEV